MKKKDITVNTELTEEDALKYGAQIYASKIFMLSGILFLLVLPAVIMPYFSCKLCVYAKKFKVLPIVCTVLLVLELLALAAFLYVRFSYPTNAVAVFSLIGVLSGIALVWIICAFTIWVGLNAFAKKKSPYILQVISEVKECGGKNAEKSILEDLNALAKYRDSEAFISTVRTAHEYYESKKADIAD